jgi:hypothetical protein
MDEIRPIDANALKEKLLNSFAYIYGRRSGKTFTKEMLEKVFQIIDNTPTINPEKKVQTPSCLTNPERYEELLERYKEE